MTKHFSDIKPMELFYMKAGNLYRKLAGEYCIITEHCCSNDTKRYVNCVSVDGILTYAEVDQKYLVKV